MSSNLEKMRERINNLKDLEMLEIARDLLTEMADIQRLKEQIELREEGLVQGKRAAFYYFAQGLNPEELSHAANTANGRLRFLREKKEREEAAALRNGEISQEKSSDAKEEKPKFNNTFGGLGSSFGGK